jgi:hypothetical protein
MSRYSESSVRRAKSSLKRWMNAAADTLRAPILKPTVLLVTGDASPGKVREVDVRLRHLLDHLPGEVDTRTVRRAAPMDYLRQSGVVTADSAAAPLWVRKLRWFADLDYDANPTDGMALMDFGTALSGGTRERIGTSHRIFVRRVNQLKMAGNRPVYLFGTGPSLQLAANRSFSDGIVVVCNTVVRDAELWHHLNPDILTAGDAIYHFGHTPHARAFRADALRRLIESEGRTLFVYPLQFDVIVRPEFGEVESLLVPIPWGGHTDVTVDLTERFCLPGVGNVLNVLLLPLGCTMSPDVRLWGFDGRAPNDSGFWANSDRHSYPELMQSIRDAHPAFFASMTPAGNEIQYVNEVHGDWLDDRLTEAEERGFSFQMLHRSWTPTLQKRYRESISERVD